MSEGTYKIVVEFTRQYEDDNPVVEGKTFAGLEELSHDEKLACQFAEELQTAYIHPDIAMAGHFQILSVAGERVRDVMAMAIDKVCDRVATEEFRKAPQKPSNADQLLSVALRYLSNRCVIEEGDGGEIVVHTGLQEGRDGNLVSFLGNAKESNDEPAHEFYVGVREVHVSTRKVRARSKEEALEIIKNGTHLVSEEMSEFSHTLGPETWTVEKG